jgi:hypothetical protein
MLKKLTYLFFPRFYPFWPLNEKQGYTDNSKYWLLALTLALEISGRSEVFKWIGRSMEGLSGCDVNLKCFGFFADENTGPHRPPLMFQIESWEHACDWLWCHHPLLWRDKKHAAPENALGSTLLSSGLLRFYTISHSLNHPLALSLTHSLISYSLLLAHSLVYFLTHSLTNSLSHSLTHCVGRSVPRARVHAGTPQP